jgi:hypothetical protein
MADSAAEDFDWVAAQAACTTEQMFRRLQEGARKDVERRNASGFGRKDQWQFELNADDEQSFEVARTGPSSTGSAFVTFERDGTRINVSGDGVDVQFTAITGINPAGQCRYFVGEHEYLGWEVRKLALDLLFFEEQVE